MSKILRRYPTRIFQAEKSDQNNRTLPEIHRQLHISQGQHAINYPLHTRSRPGLNCCVKIVQLISYAHEIKNLMEEQDDAASSSLKTLHPFIDKQGLLRVGGRLQQSTLS